MLYTGPVVLHGILAKPNHFMLFCVGVTLLVSHRFCLTYNDYAKSLLNLFVEQARRRYDEDFIVYNIHGLTHLAADVKRHGSLDHCSAFPFENKLKDLKTFLRKPGYPLPQIICRLSEDRAAFKQGKTSRAGGNACSVFGKLEHCDGPVPINYEHAAQFLQLNTDCYKLNIRRSSDSCVLVRNVGPVVVVNILSVSGRPKLDFFYKSYNSCK